MCCHAALNERDPKALVEIQLIEYTFGGIFFHFFHVMI